MMSLAGCLHDCTAYIDTSRRSLKKKRLLLSQVTHRSGTDLVRLSRALPGANDKLASRGRNREPIAPHGQRDAQRNDLSSVGCHGK